MECRNQKIGKNRRRNNNINYIMDNNKKISDPSKITEHLNKFFIYISKKLNDKIRPPQNGEIKLPKMNRKIFFSNQLITMKSKISFVLWKTKIGEMIISTPKH